MRALSLTKDVAPAAVLTVAGIVFTSLPEGEGDATWLDTLAMPFLTLPVLWRRQAPLACTVAVAAGMVISGVPTFDQTRCAVALPAALLVVFTLAARRGPRQSLIGFALLLAGLAFVGATDPVVEGDRAGFLLVAGGLLAVAWAGGIATGSRQRLLAELAERSRQLERRREHAASLAVDVERTRLAGELDAAARLRVEHIVALASRPQAARDTFARIETAARDSLNEMRALLGVLRSDELPSLRSAPTLAELDALLADVRAGGRPVRLDIQGARRPLPAAVELAAYRMIQHGLAAVGSATEVDVRYRSETVELHVSGSELAGEGAEEALTAARARAAAYGGSLTVDAPLPGRRVVCASLPGAAGHG